MGNKLLAAPTSLADALFSPVQQRVLGLLFGQPGRQFQSSELIQMVGAGTGATHRVLQRLAESGLITAEVRGRQKYYQANAESPIFSELVSILRKTVGLAGPLREALLPLEQKITMAFVYGSVARGEDRAESDIDVMVIGSGLDYPDLFAAMSSAETVLGRRVNPTVMSPEDWTRKLSQGDTFAARVARGPRLLLIGDNVVD